MSGWLGGCGGRAVCEEIISVVLHICVGVVLIGFDVMLQLANVNPGVVSPLTQVEGAFRWTKLFREVRSCKAVS